jgi:hypothetical protein
MRHPRDLRPARVLTPLCRAIHRCDDANWYRPLPVELSLLFKLLHVLSAMALVTGLVGRWVTNGQAERSADLESMEALLRASLRFERMAIGG